MGKQEVEKASEKKTIAEIPKALIEWSKWLIGINFSAATGCTIMFKELPDTHSPTGIYLLYAIIFFVSSVFISCLFNFLLSTQLKESFKLKRYHFYLAGMQILLFGIALVFLCLWVYNKTLCPPIVRKPHVSIQILK
jgi:hypothetical protein